MAPAITTAVLPAKKKKKQQFRPPHLRKNPQPAQPFNPPPSHPSYDSITSSSSSALVPRYLFRLHTPSSKGETTTRHVASAAAASPRRPRSSIARAARRDIFAAEPSWAADALANHLLWRSNGPLTHHNLVSWSSSLLVVLQHGLRRAQSSRGVPDLERVRLLVVDTRELPHGAFISDLRLMAAFAPHSQDLADLHRLRTTATHGGEVFYFGEYLSQGYLRVEGCARETSLQRMVDCHLFKLCPGLADRSGWSRWAKRVMELRRAYDVAGGRPQLVDTGVRDVRRAVVLASSCFGDDYALVIAAMVLALLPRDVAVGGPVITGLRNMFTGL